MRLVVELYGAGLERTVELAGPEALDRFVGDELVASLLVLHDLHPKDTETRVVEALDQVRPYLGSHAGGVELLGVDPERGGPPAPGGQLRRLPVLDPDRQAGHRAGHRAGRPRGHGRRGREPDQGEGAAAAPDPAAAPGVGGGRRPRRAGAGPPDRGRGRRGRGGGVHASAASCTPTATAARPAAPGWPAWPPWTTRCWPAGRAGSASTSGWPAAGSTGPSSTWSPCPCWPATAGSAWRSGRERHELRPAAVRRAAAGAGRRCRGRP